MTKSSILVILAASQPWTAMSWLANPHHGRTMPALGRRAVRLEAGPFFDLEEEFECPEDEDVECEIDWDAMPGAASASASVEPSSKAPAAAAGEEELTINANSFAAQAMESLDRTAVRLEMNWQIDECKTDEDMCEDFCEDCAGSGKMHCRFCRGTGITTLGDEFRACVICKSGIEECASCRGTGHIAPWATTMENFLDDKDGKSI